MAPPGPRFLPSIWQRVYWLPRDLRVAWRFRRYASMVYYGASLGDNLLCTAVVRELKARRDEPVAMLTDVPEFFAGNPHLAAVLPCDWGEVASLRRLGRKLLRPDYAQMTADPDIRHPPARHVIAEMCSSIGLRGEVSLVPELYLSEAERTAGRLAPQQVAIISSGTGAAFRIRNKEWPPERFQPVVDQLRSEYTLVQLGTSQDPPLVGTQDLRGKTTLRQTAAILANCEAYIGLEGMVMHLARAVGCRSVIIYGGRVHPEQLGYPCNENLYTPVPCAPCWRDNGCDYARRCLTAIEPSHVLEAFARLRTRINTPLEIARAVL